MTTVFDCIVIGGGIAGLQASIQLGRYQHKTAVIDSNHGRSTICRNYHNILGWPDGVSGERLRELGKMHAERYGVSFYHDKVVNIREKDQELEVICQSNDIYLAKKLLLATGIMDRLPEIKNLIPCLGLSIYVCPDCDGYEIVGKRVVVLGAGKTGAKLALTLTQWSKSIVYINHDGKELNEDLRSTLNNKGIEYIKEEIGEILVSEASSEIKGVMLKSGQLIEAEKGFVGFGGNEVRTELVQGLGIERMENKHIIVDPRTKKTSHPNIWAAGDIAVHSEQVTIAMGDGMQAAIWIHKSIINQS